MPVFAPVIIMVLEERSSDGRAMGFVNWEDRKW